MIVLLQPTVSAEGAHAIAERIRALGLQVIPLDDAKGRALEVLGEERGKVLTLDEPGIREVLTRRVPLVGGEPVWPHFALRLGILAILVVSTLLVLTAFLPPGLGDPATHERAAAAPLEWYLRPAGALLARTPGSLGWIGGTAILALGLVLLFLPWIDRGDASKPRDRAVAQGVRAAATIVLLLTVLSMLGVLS